MNIPFEYCALRYLLQWERSEKELYLTLSDAPNTEQLRRALKFFQIARNSPRLKEEGKAQFIINTLKSIKHPDEEGCTYLRVEELANCLKREFGQYNLSAASKLLWLRQRKPYIIYDSRAVKALKNADEVFDTRSYFEYSKAWKRQYSFHRSRIKSACERLVEIRDFFPAWYISERSMTKVVTETWFRERVFDIYLWEVGGTG